MLFRNRWSKGERDPLSGIDVPRVMLVIVNFGVFHFCLSGEVSKIGHISLRGPPVTYRNSLVTEPLNQHISIMKLNGCIVLVSVASALTPFATNAFHPSASIMTSNKARVSVSTPCAGALNSPLSARSEVKTALKVTGSESMEESGEWTEKKLHNTPLFRSGSILAALGLAGYVSGSPLAALPSKTAATVHLLAFGTWFGSVVYTTFIAGITMFKNLPRKTFGRLQSKLFPKYFMLGATTILLQLITLKSLSSVPTAKATKALGSAFVMTLLNLFYLEPTSTRIMFDRYELEEQEGGKNSAEYKKLAGNFGKFHGMSSLSNLVALCGAVAHGFFLASALALV